MNNESRTAWMKVDEIVTIVDPGYVFPQGITDHTGKEIRRAGGLTKRELFAAMIASNIQTAPLTEQLARDIVTVADQLLKALDANPRKD